MKNFIEIEMSTEKKLLSIRHIVAIEPNTVDTTRILMDITKNKSDAHLHLVANEPYDEFVKRLKEIDE